MCVLLITWMLRGVARWARKSVNHTSWVAVVTPNDRPMSVRNRCSIELFCGVVCVVALPFWHFCWCRGFCHRTRSDLLLFVFKTNLIKKKQKVINNCNVLILSCYSAPGKPCIIPEDCSAENNSVTIAWQPHLGNVAESYSLELDDGSGGDFRVSDVRVGHWSCLATLFK